MKETVKEKKTFLTYYLLDFGADKGVEGVGNLSIMGVVPLKDSKSLNSSHADAREYSSGNENSIVVLFEFKCLPGLGITKSIRSWNYRQGSNQDEIC